MKKKFVISCLTANSKHFKFEYNLVKTFIKKFPNISLILIVRKKGLLPNNRNIKYIELKDYEKSIFHKLYIFYFKLNKISKEINSDYWLSTDNLTRRVQSKKLFSYYHTPSPFFKGRLPSKLNSIIFFIQGLIYGFFIKLFIKRNNFLIVQSNWMKKIFINKYNIKKIIVAHLDYVSSKPKKIKKNKKHKKFFYPTYPHIYKNFEVIGESSKILEKSKTWNGKIFFTFDVESNNYAKAIYNKYKNIKFLKFLGHQTQNKIDYMYKKSDVLIFPSFMETWGLPISEAKRFNLPMIVSNLKYAYETVGSYHTISFFNPKDPKSLAELLIKANEGTNIFTKSYFKNPSKFYAQNHEKLLKLLIN